MDRVPFEYLRHLVAVPVVLGGERQARFVLESEESLAARRATGTVVGVRVERDGPSISVFLPLHVPGGPALEVEVDMGSDVLILDAGLAERVGVDLDDGHPSCARAIPR